MLQPAITTTTHSAPPVLQNQGLFHCLTTAAPDAAGRPPPARTNEKPDTMARWRADDRRFAPWQYQAKYLVTSQQGTTSLAPAAMREQMMGFSGTHTANMTHDPTEYHRNKALGNTWHVPTATWLLFIVLLNTLAIPATAVSYTPTQRATAMASKPRTLRTTAPTIASTLHATVFMARPLAMGQNVRRQSHPESSGSNPGLVRPSGRRLPPHHRVPQTSRRRDTTTG